MFPFYEPTIRYDAINRDSTAAVAENEALQYDAIFESDGSTAELDVTGDDGKLLSFKVLRQRPNARAQSEQREIPTVTPPRRTVEVFHAPRAFERYIPRMGGQTLKFGGATFSISRAVAKQFADVTIYLELHVDPNDGLVQPAPARGLL